MNLPNCKKPCGNCPFRKDTLKGWLGKGCITEILNSDSFVCHKKTELQCAGFMLLKKDESIFYSTATEMNINLNLKGSDKVFKTKEACIEHHT